MVYLVGVMGASGYAGGELLRLLAGHPEFAVIAAGANQQVGVPIRQIHPSLAVLDPGRFVPNDDPRLLAADVVFSALPHGQSAGLARQASSALAVIDLGADHRLIDSDQWRHFYGDAARSDPWTYGLPELPGQRVAIRASTRVANPGCYATAVQLALAPFVGAGLLAQRPIAVVAASGTTGAGRNPVLGLLASQVMGSMSAYKVGGVHQHIPEIEQQLTVLSDRPVQLCLSPLLAPMPRGIIASCTASLVSMAAGWTAAQAHEFLGAAYQTEPFITVLPPGEWPATGATLASNQTLLQVTTDQRTETITVVSVLDNLGKGAAGQAMQNANIMLGLPEGLGLSQIGVAP